MQKLHTCFSIKSLEDIGTFSGYASVYHLVDSQEDWVMPGAFGVLKSQESWPKMLWHHDPADPIGEWLSITEDSRGLFVKGRLFLDLQRGREVHLLLKTGVVDGLSIGYRPLKASKTPKGRCLESIVLEEISLVTFPSNPEARVQEVKIDVFQRLTQQIESLTALVKRTV